MTASTAVAARPATALTPQEQIARQFDRPETVNNLKAMLPPHISVERFKRTFLVAIQRNPELATLDRQSLYLAVNAAAQDGLLPDGQEAALVPVKGKVAYWRMVAGVLKKARNSGEIKSITAQTVHANDKFSYWVDEHGEHLEHRPNMLGERGAFVGVYAMAQTKDGGIYMEVQNKEHINKVRAVSRAGSGGPWDNWFEEQAKKTALKALCKRLPSSTDILGTELPTKDELEDDDPPMPAFHPAEVADPVAAAAPAPAPKAGSRTRAAAGVVVPPAAPAQAEAADGGDPAYDAAQDQGQQQGDGGVPL